MALERANYEPESICFADRIYPLQLGLYPGGQHRPQAFVAHQGREIGARRLPGPDRDTRNLRRAAR